MDTIAIITTLVAVYGAGLSTALAAQQFRDRKPRLRISLALVASQQTSGSSGKVYLFTTYPGDPQARYLSLKAENIGQRVVTLNTVGLLPPKDDLILLPQATNNSEFPRRLEPGEDCMNVWPADEVAHNLRAAGYTGTIPLGAFYVDGLRKHHRAKPLAFDVDAWEQK